MIYYRVAIWGSQSASWRWKSSSLTSLHGVLGVLKLYHCVPREHIRVFLITSLDHMEEKEMLNRIKQGLLSTAITVDHPWGRHSVNWNEVRRLEVELGAGGDHDKDYAWSLPPSVPYALAWMKLRDLREQGHWSHRKFLIPSLAGNLHVKNHLWWRLTRIMHRK